MDVCVCVCARARLCVCVCVRVYAHARVCMWCVLMRERVYGLGFRFRV